MIDKKENYKVILLIDDEVLIRKTGQRLLSKLGYSVLLAADGQEALDLYRKKQGDVSLVLLDMIMPGMTGRETFEQLQKINPSVKVLLTSGYDKNDKIDQLIDAGAAGFLQKPYNMTILNDTVSSAFA